MSNEEIDALDVEIQALEQSLGEAGAVTAAFAEEIGRMQQTLAATGVDAEKLSSSLSRGLKTAFDGLVFGGFQASDALKTVAQSLVNTAYSAAIKPVTSHLGGLLAQAVTGSFANGGAFSQGRVVPFAKGGVVASPTAFPMRGGTGLMGEAGPEAIIPLARGADGRLGVRSNGMAGGVNIVMNISTPDAPSFQRSQSQIAAQVTRALSRGQRNG